MALELEDANDWKVMCAYLGREDLDLGDDVITPSTRHRFVRP